MTEFLRAPSVAGYHEAVLAFKRELIRQTLLAHRGNSKRTLGTSKVVPSSTTIRESAAYRPGDPSAARRKLGSSSARDRDIGSLKDGLEHVRSVYKAAGHRGVV